MTSLIKVPSRYDVRIETDGLELVCTDHVRPCVIAASFGSVPFMGVDRIIGLVEQHERTFH